MTRVAVEAARRGIASFGPYKVKSCADGTYRVTPKYSVRRGVGLLARLRIAIDIEAVLNARKPIVRKGRTKC